MIALIKACFIITTFLFYTSTHATMTFSSKNAALFLQNNNSKLRATPTSILGWKNRSIVKNVTGGGWGDYNLKQYDLNSNSIITYSESPSDLVYNNSNALKIFPTPIRTQSNAVARGIRNISNTIMAGFSRSPIRYDSNAINYVSPVVRTNSNAFARGTRNNSQSMIYLSRINKNAAQAITYVKQAHTVLTNRQTVSLMRFNNGFTILPGQYAILDTSISVSGGFDLRDTGSLALRGNLRLDGNTTLTNGGRIYGKNTGIILDGNLTLAANKVLHLDGSTFIDGNGHTLYVGDNAQIFVDTDATVTLRNLVIRNGQHASTFPPIRLASHGSKLCLDNTTLAPGNDFLFAQGQFFVHNDVKFTGTSAFIYTSPIPSWITSGGRLYFDFGTTFSIAPATFTDAPYTLKNTYTNCNFIKMADKSSQLYLNGCSLMTTLTGNRFAHGSINLNNKNTFKTATNLQITNYNTQIGNTVNTGESIIKLNWSPDGRFIAIANAGISTGHEENRLKIYKFNGVSTPTLVTYAPTNSNGVYTVGWSPDSRFIAMGTSSFNEPNTLSIYRFDGSNLTRVGSAVSTGSDVYEISWSPDGKYIAVANWSSTYNLHIYQFNGSSTPELVGYTLFASNSCVTAKWSPDGRFIATGLSTSSNNFQIYKFNGASNPTIVDSAISTGDNIGSVNWSPDNRFIIASMTGGSPNNFGIYRFNGTSKPNLVGSMVSIDGQLYSTCWSRDARFIAIGSMAFSNNLRIYQFNGSSQPTLVGSAVTAGEYISCIDWSSDGKFIAVGSNNTSDNLRIYRITYGSETTPQALSKSIVFGDSAKGADYDADVTLLGGARIEVQGKVNYDCVN
jgi:WD40 repeat protein